MENQSAEKSPPAPTIPTPLLGLVQARGDTPGELVLWKRFENHEFFVKREYPEAPKWDWIILDASGSPSEFGEAVTFEAAEHALAAAAYQMFTGTNDPIEKKADVASKIYADASHPTAHPCNCHTCGVLEILRALVGHSPLFVHREPTRATPTDAHT
jgi:hypothetical protein